MDIRADDVRVACPLFQEERGGSTPTSALQLRLVSVPFSTAKELNSLWHSRLPLYREPECGQLCWAAEHEGVYFGVAIWTHPISRMLPQDTWLELRRLAIAPDAPKNTASRMLGVMASLIRKSRPRVVRLMSYQDAEAHTGTIYKAAGWTAAMTGKGHEWNNASRRRKPAQSVADKVRWEKVL